MLDRTSGTIPPHLQRYKNYTSTENLRTIYTRRNFIPISRRNSRGNDPHISPLSHSPSLQLPITKLRANFPRSSPPKQIISPFSLYELPPKSRKNAIKQNTRAAAFPLHSRACATPVCVCVCVGEPLSEKRWSSRRPCFIYIYS